jgi:hypothetical protein
MGVSFDMKRFFVLMGAFALMFCVIMPARTALAQDPYTITFDEFDESYFGAQIDEEYAYLGIHFTTDPPTSPAISFYPANVYSAGTWPNSPFSFVPIPTGQFLAMDKPQGESVVTGVGMTFDYFCTEIAFDYRRPGNNAVSYTLFYVELFDTTQSGEPFYSGELEAIVKPPDGSDSNGYLHFSVAAPAPFNMVALPGNKKFQIDNLSITPGDSASGDEGEEVTPAGSLSPIGGEGVGGAGCFVSSLVSCTPAEDRMEALQLACILMLSLMVGGHVAMRQAKSALEGVK